MDYKIVKIKKITNQTLGTNEKIVMFRWIAERITAYSEHATWVACGIGDSQKIKKIILTFKGKSW